MKLLLLFPTKKKVFFKIQKPQKIHKNWYNSLELHHFNNNQWWISYFQEKDLVGFN